MGISEENAQNALCENREKLVPLWKEYAEKAKLVHLEGNALFVHSTFHAESVAFLKGTNGNTALVQGTDVFLPDYSREPVLGRVQYARRQEVKTVESFVETANKEFKACLKKVVDYVKDGSAHVRGVNTELRILLAMSGPAMNGFVYAPGPMWDLRNETINLYKIKSDGGGEKGFVKDFKTMTFDVKGRQTTLLRLLNDGQDVTKLVRDNLLDTPRNANAELGTTAQFKDLPLSKKDSEARVECCVHGHQPNSMGMFVREGKDQGRLSVDTRYKGGCIAYGYVGRTPATTFGTEEEQKKNAPEAHRVHVHKSEKDLCAAIVKASGLKESGSLLVYVGPLVGKTFGVAMTDEVRMLYFKKGRSDWVVFASEQLVTTTLFADYSPTHEGFTSLRDEKAYCALSLCCFKLEEGGAFGSVPFETGPLTDARPDCMLVECLTASAKGGLSSFQPACKTIEVDNTEYVVVACMASSADVFCGQLLVATPSALTAPTFPTFHPREDTSITSVLVGSDFEGHEKDWLTYKNILNKLDSTGDRVKRFYCGDCTDVGLNPVATLTAAAGDGFHQRMMGNRDLNKLRWLAPAKGEASDTYERRDPHGLLTLYEQANGWLKYHAQHGVLQADADSDAGVKA